MQKKINVGGPAKVVNITLRVAGAIDPQALTLAIGISPSYSHRQGDRVSKRSNEGRKAGMWMLERKLASITLEQQIAELLDQLPRPGEWRRSIGTAIADLYCEVEVSDDLQGIELSAGVMQLLATYGIDVGFSIHCDCPSHGRSAGEQKDSPGD
jgi:hypothetical protein